MTYTHPHVNEKSSQGTHPWRTLPQFALAVPAQALKQLINFVELLHQRTTHVHLHNTPTSSASHGKCTIEHLYKLINTPTHAVMILRCQQKHILIMVAGTIWCPHC